MHSLRALRFLIAFALIAVLLASIPCASADTASFKETVRKQVLDVIDQWPDEGQYAIMFFVYANEGYEYAGYHNVTEFQMLCNCESDLAVNLNPIFEASSMDECRWNVAFWNFDWQVPIIDIAQKNPVTDALLDWYQELGIDRVGDEDDSGPCYNDLGGYIGCGPVGFHELLDLVTEIAAELQEEGVLAAKFGRPLPIIIADFEFTWYMLEATQKANPHGEAAEYFAACQRVNVVPSSWNADEQ